MQRFEREREIVGALRAGLGADLTPALEQVWRSGHGALADAMQAGAGASEHPALAA